MNLQALVQKVDGYKTYGVALLTVLDGLYQYYIQHGSKWQSLAAYLLVGGGVASVRSALKKLEG